MLLNVSRARKLRETSDPRCFSLRGVTHVIKWGDFAENACRKKLIYGIIRPSWTVVFGTVLEDK